MLGVGACDVEVGGGLGGGFSGLLFFLCFAKGDSASGFFFAKKTEYDCKVDRIRTKSNMTLVFWYSIRRYRKMEGKYEDKVI